jgi:hypothetical protein
MSLLSWTSLVENVGDPMSLASGRRGASTPPRPRRRAPDTSPLALGATPRELLGKKTDVLEFVELKTSFLWDPRTLPTSASPASRGVPPPQLPRQVQINSRLLPKTLFYYVVRF